MMTNNETTLVMVQKYIPEVKQGDIRVMTLGDKILPYAIKKLPTQDDFKFNTHNDDLTPVIEFDKCGENVYYDLRENGTLYIYGLGEMINYSSGYSPFSGKDTIINYS